MKLYSYFRSSAAYRVNIALNLKQITREYSAVNLLEGRQLEDKYRAINPQGLVPTFETDRGILSQSLAIIEYLNEKFPRPALLPKVSWEKAHVRSLAYSIACDIHPLNNLRVLKYLNDEFNASDEQRQQWYQHWIYAGFTALETLINSSSKTNSRYCYGDAVSLADLCLVPQMYNARRYNINLDPFPKLVDIDSHLTELPAFKAALPEQQADSTITDKE